MISAAAAALPQLALISAIDAPTCPTESEIAPPTIGIKLPAANCTVFMTAEPPRPLSSSAWQARRKARSSMRYR